MWTEKKKSTRKVNKKLSKKNNLNNQNKLKTIRKNKNH